MKAVLSLLATLPGLAATGAFAQSAPSAPAPLKEVVVQGRDVSPYVAEEASAAGALGTRPLLDTPFSINVVPQALISDQQARLLTEVLRNDPSAVAGFGAQYSSYQTISLRGFPLAYNANYRRDGLPFNRFSETAFENLQQVEVLKGLSGMLNGFASPGGIVNFVPKRPTNETYTSLRAGYTSQSLFSIHGDAGGRFGPDRQFGYRVNLVREQGETSIDRVDLARTLGSVYLDWRVSPALTLGLDVEKHRIQPTGQPLYYALGANVPVPAAPDLRRFNGIPYATYTTNDTLVGFRADLALSDDWRARLSLLDHRHDRDAWFSQGTISNTGGAMSVVTQRDVLQSFPARSALATLSGRFATGLLRHELTTGINWSTNESYRGDYQFAPPYLSNLNAPVEAPVRNLSAVRAQYRNASYEERGAFVSDTISLGKAVAITAGVRHTRLQQQNLTFAGAISTDYARSATTPSLGVVFKPMPNLSIYGSYIEGLEQGGVAPAGRVNAGEVMAPLESRQIEAGVKWHARTGLFVSAAIFEIEKALEFTNVATNRFVQDGRQVHQGLELTANGRVTRSLDLFAGVMVLDPTAERTGNPAIDGRRPVNVPRLTLNGFAQYRLPGTDGLSVNGGFQYVGDRPFDATNSRVVGSFALFNAGLRLDSRLAGRKAIYRVNVDNIADKRYWASAGTTLHAGLPRTLKFSMQIEH
jgi:iron complex outermembrane receptor protein